MSRDTNEGFMMRFKTITTNLLTIVHLLFEPIIYLEKPKDYLEASISIRQIPWTLTFSNPVIPPYLFSYFFFGNMLGSNRYWWGTVKSHVGNSSDCCGGRNTTGKMKCTAGRYCISIIDLIKGGYFLCWVTSIRWKLLLRKSLASRSENSLILINLL